MSSTTTDGRPPSTVPLYLIRVPELPSPLACWRLRVRANVPIDIMAAIIGFTARP